MSVETVKAYLAAWGRDKDVLEFDRSSATVELAARAAGVEEGRIAKTLAFAGPEGPMVVVAAGDARVHNGKFKQAFGLKSKMLPPEETLEATGHAVGGVCPFALKEPRVKVWLDESLKWFDTVFPACGSSNSAIELTPDELMEYAGADGWVDVCKLPSVVTTQAEA